MKKSNFLNRLGISLPIIQAPMAGGITTPELIAAVSNAGGLGSLGAGYMNGEEIKKTVKQIRTLTNKPFAINLFIPEPVRVCKDEMTRACQTLQTVCAGLNLKIDPIDFSYRLPFEEQINAIVETQVPIVSFTFGILEKKWITQLKRRKIILIGTATHLQEAQRLMAFPIDALVAQGREAGGHRGTFIEKGSKPLLKRSTLMAQIKKCLTVPIVTAGGVMTPTHVLEALKQGAGAVQVGTAFLSCPESGAHPKYKEIILQTTQDETVLSRAFSGKWGRLIHNKFTQQMAHRESILPFPLQYALTLPLRRKAAQDANPNFMALWAGQLAYLSQALPAAELLQFLIKKI